MELLKEIIPKLSRVAVFRDLTNVTEGIGVDEIEPTARVLKIQTQRFELAKVEDFDSQFQAIMKWRPGGLMIGGGPLMNGHRKRIVEFAAKNKLPAMYNRDEFVEAGGLVSYATSFIDLSRRAATYVDKILKGNQARRLSGRAAEEVRVHHQSESSEADRPDDSAERAGESGQR